MSQPRAWQRSARGDEWLPGTYHTIQPREAGWVITAPHQVETGPFPTLDAAKVAYLLIVSVAP